MVAGGADVGEAMVKHPGIDKVQFVGSGATAKKVLRTAAETLKPCGLELGGKSAVIVFADADLQQAARRGLSGAISVSGQGCVNGTRLLVERPIYEQYLKMLQGIAAHIKVGDPLDPTTVMGPDHFGKLGAAHPRHDRQRREEGRRAPRGRRRAIGRRLRRRATTCRSRSLPMSISNSALAQHEVFGPVLAVTPFDTEDEAIALANGTSYGLGAYIHTENLRRAPPRREPDAGRHGAGEWLRRRHAALRAVRRHEAERLRPPRRRARAARVPAGQERVDESGQAAGGAK